MEEKTKKQTTHSWGRNQADKKVHKYTLKKQIAYKEQFKELVVGRVMACTVIAETAASIYMLLAV